MRKGHILLIYNYVFKYPHVFVPETHTLCKVPDPALEILYLVGVRQFPVGTKWGEDYTARLGGRFSSVLDF